MAIETEHDVVTHLMRKMAAGDDFSAEVMALLSTKNEKLRKKDNLIKALITVLNEFDYVPHVSNSLKAILDEHGMSVVPRD